MSNIFTTLIKDVKTFASKVEAGLKKLFGEMPKIEQIIASVLTVVAPLLQTLVALVDPVAAPATAAILAEIKTDLATAYTASVAVNTIADSSSIKSALTNIQSNLPALLAAAKVENVGVVSQIEGFVNAITPELEAVLTAL
jgi:hypothetical protein